MSFGNLGSDFHLHSSVIGYLKFFPSDASSPTDAEAGGCLQERRVNCFPALGDAIFQRPPSALRAFDTLGRVEVKEMFQDAIVIFPAQ
ncbi:hypothetical protein [Nesterenkonia sp. YGD6]|uniref:hypothetical protein n=1 Tax=Nesterenkonia sp. YGD6 TaxID=2901231 RepID=UPI001F4D0CB8|nr:hypothetical protein [Nesterenkonia sp. YGD6]